MAPLRMLALLGALVLVSAPAPADAQWRPQGWMEREAVARPVPAALRPASAVQVVEARPSVGGMIRSGLIGGAIGAGAGLLAPGGKRSIGGTIRNASLGAAVGIPLGVHRGNRGRGSLLLSGLASLGIGVAVFHAAGAGGDAVPLLAAAPAAELAASILVEQATSP